MNDLFNINTISNVPQPPPPLRGKKRSLDDSDIDSDIDYDIIQNRSPEENNLSQQSNKKRSLEINDSQTTNNSDMQTYKTVQVDDDTQDTTAHDGETQDTTLTYDTAHEGETQDIEPNQNIESVAPPVFSPSSTISTPTVQNVFDRNKMLDNTSSYINENDYLRFLAGADSIHDFNDCGGRVPSSYCNVVTKGLYNELCNVMQTPINDVDVKSMYKNWLDKNESLTKKRVTAVSKIEEQTMEFFEKEFPLELANDEKNITYRQILNAINTAQGNTINKKIYNSMNILKIDENVTNLFLSMEFGEDWGQNYSPQDKIYIGLFILNFYFTPDDNVDNNTQLPTYITFDAGSPIPTSIFGLLDQVINMVTPLNVADSATAESHLIVKVNGKKGKRTGVKNYYHFPITNEFKNPITNEFKKIYKYTSNIYTRDQYQLLLQKPSDANYEYGEGKQYDFNITVKKDQYEENISFNKNEKSGPSVTYLSTLIGYGNGIPESKMINISNNTFIKDKPLLYDLKRTGDWEQCNAAKTSNSNDGPQQNRTLLCTLDRLCALYSRCIGQNTIYHQATNLSLYRFKTGVTSDSDGTKFALKKFALKKLNNLLNNYTVLNKIMDKIPKNYNLSNNFIFTDKDPQYLKIFVNDLIGKTNSHIKKAIEKAKQLISDKYGNANVNNLLQDKINDLSNNAITRDKIDECFNFLKEFPDILKQFLLDISEIFGQPITVENYEKTFKYIETKISNTLIGTKNKLDIRIGYCDIKLLNYIKSEVNFIVGVKPTSRNLERENYYEKFSEFIEKIKYLYNILCINIDEVNSETVKPYCNIFNKIININYEPVNINETSFTLSEEYVSQSSKNSNYIDALQSEVKKLINMKSNSHSYGGSNIERRNKEIKGGDYITDSNVLGENFISTLLNEFLVLTNSIGEITYELNLSCKKNFEELIDEIKTIELTDLIKYNIQKYVYEFVNNIAYIILENEYYINTINDNSQIESFLKIYISVCFFFSSVYYDGKIINKNNNNQNMEMTDELQYSDIDNNNQNMEMTDELQSSNIDNNFENAKKYEAFPLFFKEINNIYDDNVIKIINDFEYFIYFNRLNIKTSTLSDFGNYLFLTLKLIINLKEKEINSENIILIVILFYQNYFKYIILKCFESKSIISSESEINAVHYGYYESILSEYIINIENDEKIRNNISNKKIVKNNIDKFFNTLTKKIKGKINSFKTSNKDVTKISIEYNVNKLLLNDIDVTIYQLLEFINDPINAIAQSRELNRIMRGGKNKKTRKLRGITRRKRTNMVNKKTKGKKPRNIKCKTIRK